MYRQSLNRFGGEGGYRGRGGGTSPRRNSPRRYQALPCHTDIATADNRGHYQPQRHAYDSQPHPHSSLSAPQPIQDQQDVSFRLLLTRVDIATQVLQQLSQQMTLTTSGRARSPSPATGHVVTSIAGDKIRVDPSARHCQLCDTSYNIQIARQHFEGKRHRQHLIRLVHLREHEQLEQQALLARQAGLALTEDLYGPFASRPLGASLHSHAPSQPEANGPLRLPEALRHELQRHSDNNVGGILMQELLALFDAQRPAPQQHRPHSFPNDTRVGAGVYQHNRGLQHAAEHPTARGGDHGVGRSYFHSAGEQLRSQVARY
jgi:hypothetical protein